MGLSNKAWEFLAKGSLKDFAVEKQPFEVFKRPHKEKTEYIDGMPFDKENVWRLFLKYYAVVNYKPFQKGEGVVENLEPIFKYFMGDPTFSESNRVLKKAFGSELIPDLSKGLLIISATGNGKTSIMNTFHEVFKSQTIQARECRWKNFNDWNSKRFSFSVCRDIVIEYDGLKEPHEKKSFFDYYGSAFPMCFDELMRERKTTNFGKLELMTDVLAKRYDNRALTFLTMNYAEEQKPEKLKHLTDVEWTLLKARDRYGSHIFDRFFEMVNIIVFDGKSFRK